MSDEYAGFREQVARDIVALQTLASAQRNFMEALPE